MDEGVSMLILPTEMAGERVEGILNNSERRTEGECAQSQKTNQGGSS